MKTIIGSAAIKHHLGDLLNREPKDLDFAVYHKSKDYVSKTETINGVRHEYLPNNILLFWLEEQHGHIPQYCPLDELLTLKMSHSFWALENNSWEKHMWDIGFLIKQGAEFIPELFHKLYTFWNDVHGKNRRSDLEMSAEEFFDNALNYHIPHDDIHEMLIKHEYFNNQKKPTYVKVLKTGAEVDVCETKFKTLTEKEKFNLVFEEVAVMATERFGNMYFKKAYNRMLKKFILGHAPIWEAIWIIQNHENLLTNIPFNFINFLKQQ